ncbi:hypothetical protein EVAR_93569_1 [Eumeta japonica]|uniref:Uncharacterized protein n=1 Tax=Eumeta variegata TaxID=151549 RepID=A0A4C1USY4_EUMVA|nr:hypothetical protein EVAR_93569_1 [Eumeta japonica]
MERSSQNKHHVIPVQTKHCFARTEIESHAFDINNHSTLGFGPDQVLNFDPGSALYSSSRVPFRYRSRLQFSRARSDCFEKLPLFRQLSEFPTQDTSFSAVIGLFGIAPPAPPARRSLPADDSPRAKRRLSFSTYCASKWVSFMKSAPSGAERRQMEPKLAAMKLVTKTSQWCKMKGNAGEKKEESGSAELAHHNIRRRFRAAKIPITTTFRQNHHDCLRHDLIVVVVTILVTPLILFMFVVTLTVETFGTDIEIKNTGGSGLKLNMGLELAKSVTGIEVKSRTEIKIESGNKIGIDSRID